MARFWMVRAGEGGYLSEDFEKAGCVALGWSDAGDFADVKTREEIKERLRSVYPDYKPGATASSAAMIFKFRHEIEPGDFVVTYDATNREYLLGTIASDYRYEPEVVRDYSQVRDVKWLGRVSRDRLSPEARSTLSPVLTLFEPKSVALEQLQRHLAGDESNGADAIRNEEEEQDQLSLLRQDVLGRSHEFIMDRILALSAGDMEQLVAALLRAMGFRARVTRQGPDRGRDVIASPDGLGLQKPRIVAEVKHRRRESMGAQAVRSFLGALRASDCGLYVSTGGFTREARYEAERATVPTTLVDLDDLASLVVEHYDGFDADGRALLPLVRLYWPAS